MRSISGIVYTNVLKTTRIGENDYKTKGHGSYAAGYLKVGWALPTS